MTAEEFIEQVKSLKSKGELPGYYVSMYEMSQGFFVLVGSQNGNYTFVSQDFQEALQVNYELTTL